MIPRRLASLVVRVAGAPASFGFQGSPALLLGSADTGVYTANAASHTLAAA